MTDEQRIALGYRPRTLRGWLFWLRQWSPLALWLRRLLHAPQTYRDYRAHGVSRGLALRYVLFNLGWR